MNPKYQEIATINARLITDKPVRKTPYQVKGILMKQFANQEIVPMLDGSYREKFLYPRVQVKILNEQIYFVGIGEGVDPIKEIVSNIDSLDFGNITFQISDREIEEYKDRFQPSEKLIRYRFITPWVALNQSTGKKYRNIKNKDRVNYLNKLLGQNIVFLSREMGIELEENIFTKIGLSTLLPKSIDENHWGSFDGEFETNFILPNYIGIGNGITRGFGTLFGLFNIDGKDLKQVELDSSNNNFDEKLSVQNDAQEIDVTIVPSSNNSRKRKKSKPKLSKKILNEEFDLEEDDISDTNSKPNANKGVKQKKRYHRKKPKTKTSSGEVNYNSEEYHKKQHKF